MNELMSYKFIVMTYEHSHEINFESHPFLFLKR